MYRKIIGLAVLPFLLAGCADNINSDHYNTNQAGKVSTVSQCTVCLLYTSPSPRDCS